MVNRLHLDAARQDRVSPAVPNRMHRSLYTGRTVAILREEIVSGDLAAGTPLVETALAEAFGVSRGPVRNALIELEAEGLVFTESNGRSTVRGFSQEDLRDVLAVRLELESLGVGWGIDRGHDATTVRDAFEAMLAEKASTPRLIELDLSFHRSLVEFSGSRALFQSWLRLAPILHALVTVGNRRLGARDGVADFERIIKAHRPVSNAVLAGDAALTRQLLAEQFAVTAEMYRID
jgi:DNA-binding GntR family transcriptional regulator